MSKTVFRAIKQVLDLRPIYYRLEGRIQAHVLPNWLALLLVRIIENATDKTSRNLKCELQKLHVSRSISDLQLHHGQSLGSSHQLSQSIFVLGDAQ